MKSTTFASGLCALVFITLLAPQPVSAAWSQTYRLLSNDADDNDSFGISVGVDGGYSVIGASRDDDGGSSSGSAYLFGTTIGNQVHKLTASDANNGDRFGLAVAISGTRVLVGAPLNDDDGSASGSAYLFDASTGNQTFKLTASDAAAGDHFGASVAIDGDLAVVGADLDSGPNSDQGSAYVFDATNGTQQQKLTAGDGQVDDYFGSSVAISGNTVVVGAPGDNDNGGDSGSAYIFDATTGNQLFKLTASDGDNDDLFGDSVAISGDLVVVGAPGDEDAGAAAGSAYVFDATSGNQLFKLVAPDAVGDEFFGISVAIDGDVIVVGADAVDLGGPPLVDDGAIYVFDASTGSFLQKLLADNDGFDLEYFGHSVSISGNTIVGGAYNGYKDFFDQTGVAFQFNAPTDTPLPATIPLLGFGIVLLIARRRSARRG